jgi:hypothetical protein
LNNLVLVRFLRIGFSILPANPSLLNGKLFSSGWWLLAPTKGITNEQVEGLSSNRLPSNSNTLEGVEEKMNNLASSPAQFPRTNFCQNPHPFSTLQKDR